MIEAKQALLDALSEAIQEVSPGATVPAAFESPKQADPWRPGRHRSHAAGQAAEEESPRSRAGADRGAAAPSRGATLAGIEIAGPGFINLRLTPAAKQQVVAEVLRAGAAFGRQPRHDGHVLVEFVSANPTGPLHLGHARQAALGDAICNLFDSRAGRSRASSITTTPACRSRRWPLGAGAHPRPGARRSGLARRRVQRRLHRRHRRRFHGEEDGARRRPVVHRLGDPRGHRRHPPVRRRLPAPRAGPGPAAFGVRFDHYFLESGLYESGRVDDTVARLVAARKTYEEGGALWLRTTDYGDDKDRVMKKSDGSYTYSCPTSPTTSTSSSAATPGPSISRGSDHHGTVARVRAGLQAANVGIPQGYPDYVLHKMVTVMKGGQEVKISKRAGSYVTLRDLVEWTSRDAVRFFLLSRKGDTEFVFDVDLALAQNNDNPVYYVQYAHARICSVLRTWVEEMKGEPDTLASADLARLEEPTELALMLDLAEYPALLARAAADLAPHDIAFYARRLASDYHSYYDKVRFLVEGDPELTRARLALLSATGQVIRNALGVLGVGAPQRM
jgi:arginyl-tRNA synthetase